MNSGIECSAPGKIIIAGEHAVVHGFPAIVSAVPLRTTVGAMIHGPDFPCSLSLDAPSRYMQCPEFHNLLEACAEDFPAFPRVYETVSRTTGQSLPPGMSFQMSVSSDLPIGAGLGSSASLCTALVACVARMLGGELSIEQIKTMSKEAEQVFHGAPSGVDTAAAAEGGTFLFKNGKIVERLASISLDGEILVVNSRLTRNTVAMVSAVREFMNGNPAGANALFERVARVVEDTWRGFTSGYMSVVRLGTLFNENQACLRELGVSTPVLDAIIKTAMDAGATGGKLTGAGGGGCVLVAAPKAAVSSIMETLWLKGYKSFKGLPSSHGVACTEVEPVG